MNALKEGMQPKKIKKKAEVDEKYCVACGVCVSNCPVGAISVSSGMYALVDTEKCVGCARCTKVCPASIIEMV